jgi:hypothetical protein
MGLSIVLPSFFLESDSLTVTGGVPSNWSQHGVKLNHLLHVFLERRVESFAATKQIGEATVLKSGAIQLDGENEKRWPVSAWYCRNINRARKWQRMSGGRTVTRSVLDINCQQLLHQAKPGPSNMKARITWEALVSIVLVFLAPIPTSTDRVYIDHQLPMHICPAVLWKMRHCCVFRHASLIQNVAYGRTMQCTSRTFLPWYNKYNWLALLPIINRRQSHILLQSE